jgi:hypothetical protein
MHTFVIICILYRITGYPRSLRLYGIQILVYISNVTSIQFQFSCSKEPKDAYSV